jgi:hypothetical protein
MLSIVLTLINERVATLNASSASSIESAWNGTTSAKTQNAPDNGSDQDYGI